MPSPAIDRYLEVKRQHPGTLLLFQMGDFYELFFDDAKTAAKVLGLTLTSRDKNSDDPIPMAGFPHHSLSNYLGKLIAQGLRVAVCDQVEDPKEAKGLVRREVTRVVTSGTLTDDELLDPKESNFLACLFPTKNDVGLAWLDVSTGRFLATEINEGAVADELARIAPVECLLPEGSPLKTNVCEQAGIACHELPAWDFNVEACHKRLLTHFGVGTLEGFDFDRVGPGLSAAGALLGYVQETQKAALSHLSRITPYRCDATLLLDESTRRSLELTRTMRGGDRTGSLIDAVDETVTPMGARLLAEWLANPLTDATRIERRLAAVAELEGDPKLQRDLRDELDGCYDLHRLTARVATGRCSPRDLRSLSLTLARLPKLKAKLSGRAAELLSDLEQRLDLCPAVRSAIDNALVDEPPIGLGDGGVIRDGFDERLDELRGLAKGGKAWIAQFQATEAERTGIANLKVGYNKVFGYFLEVTAGQKANASEEWKRVQTLKNAERYTTPELKEYETKVVSAEEEALALETKLFSELRLTVAEETLSLQQSADVLAEIDVLAGFAHLACRNNYCRPEMASEPVLHIVDGRHPVLDRLMSAGEFVPNDSRLGIADDDAESDKDPERVQLITGPNMAGKSTYIRQTALITLLAQAGSFVPAREATIGVADRIFARVGASDDVAKGQSTFMVEMTETARILNAATERSLVILDEIGRGTSTYDGLSLAWAITEHLHDTVGCRTLFATHYHELTQLAERKRRLGNLCVAVEEADGEIAFLHRIRRGSADRSYGIHVARLAGVPHSVIDRADQILSSLEASGESPTGLTSAPEQKTDAPPKKGRKSEGQLSLFAESHPVLDQLRELDLDRLTPIQALEVLARLRSDVSE